MASSSSPPSLSDSPPAVSVGAATLARFGDGSDTPTALLAGEAATVRRRVGGCEKPSGSAAASTPRARLRGDDEELRAPPLSLTLSSTTKEGSTGAGIAPCPPRGAAGNDDAPPRRCPPASGGTPRRLGFDGLIETPLRVPVARGDVALASLASSTTNDAGGVAPLADAPSLPFGAAAGARVGDDAECDLAPGIGGGARAQGSRPCATMIATQD
jgi:hypothetical protein